MVEMPTVRVFVPASPRHAEHPHLPALAHAFAAEGVDTHFTLMGDGNMHWATAMKNIDGMTTYAVRHEHCACAMAIGYHMATGKVGVASVTCGPGFTQIMTALGGAVFGRTDLAAIAKGFGLRGATITDVGQFPGLFEAYAAQDTAELWNIHVSDKVVSPNTRRGVGRGHGKM